MRGSMNKGNIILCGFMGCGKTSVGRRAAELTGRELCDLDRYIEERAGMTVSEIFDRYGEEGFRRLERQAAREVAGTPGLIIASGGGTVLSPVKPCGCVIVTNLIYRVPDNLRDINLGFAGHFACHQYKACAGSRLTRHSAHGILLHQCIQNSI